MLHKDSGYVMLRIATYRKGSKVAEIEQGWQIYHDYLHFINIVFMFCVF